MTKIKLGAWMNNPWHSKFDPWTSKAITGVKVEYSKVYMEGDKLIIKDSRPQDFANKTISVYRKKVEIPTLNIDKINQVWEED